MANFRIPNNGQVRQLGVNDTSGEIWASRNIDLSSNPGKIKLALPTEEVASSATLTDDAVQAINQLGNKIYALTDGKVYSDSTPYNAFTDDATTSFSGGQDMVTFENYLIISKDTDLARYDGGSFTSSWWVGTLGFSALTNNVPHIMEVIRSRRDTLAVTNGNGIKYYNTVAGESSIAWDDEQIACSMSVGINFGWVGTYNENGGGAQVYSWQVGNDLYTQAYPVNANAVLAIEVIDNIPYIITERGEVQKFNQAGFTTIATIPMYNQAVFLDSVETGLIQANNISRPVHPKGMRRYGDNLLVFINTDASVGDDNVNERCPGGIWEVNVTTGSMWHRCSPANESNLASSGPIYVLNDPNSRIYMGGRRNPVNTEGEEGIWREDLAGTANRGWFVTPEMSSGEFEDHFSKVIISSLHDSDDSIVVKYRTSKSLVLPVQADVTWTSTTEFNTTADLSGVVVGDEVAVMVDVGTTKLVHITAIESSATVYEVTVDEAIGTVTDVSHVQIDNWKKLDTYDTEQLVWSTGINQTNTRIQLKFYLEGDSGYPEIDRLLVKTKSGKKTKS